MAGEPVIRHQRIFAGPQHLALLQRYSFAITGKRAHSPLNISIPCGLDPTIMPWRSMGTWISGRGHMRMFGISIHRGPSSFPDDSYRAEIFQGAGKGWELSGSYDHMDFGESNVDMYGVGLGKYTGNWYFRWRTLFVPSAARLSISHHVLARDYFAGNGDDYFELNGGFGQGGEFLAGTDIVKTTRSKSYRSGIPEIFQFPLGLQTVGRLQR